MLRCTPAPALAPLTGKVRLNARVKWGTQFPVGLAESAVQRGALEVVCRVAVSVSRFRFYDGNPQARQ